MVVPDSVKEKVGELPDISGMSKVRPVHPKSVLESEELSDCCLNLNRPFKIAMALVPLLATYLAV